METEIADLETRIAAMLAEAETVDARLAPTAATGICPASWPAGARLAKVAAAKSSSSTRAPRAGRRRGDTATGPPAAAPNRTQRP